MSRRNLGLFVKKKEKKTVKRFIFTEISFFLSARHIAT